MKKIASREKVDGDFKEQKNPFHDPIAYKDRDVSYDGDAPTKEQATTGRFMQMGDYYGVGYRTPVGKEKPRSMDQGPIPQKNQCYNPDLMIRKP